MNTPRRMSLPPRLILASASPRRRELLEEIGVSFEVITAQVTEHEESTTDPRVMVAHNAALKADWVAARHPDAWVLGADTTVFIDGHALNKPVSNWPVYSNNVFFLVIVPCAEYLVYNIAVIGHKNKAFTGFIQPADRKNTLWVINIIYNVIPNVQVGGTFNTYGLVESQINIPACLFFNKLAVDTYFVFGCNFGAHFRNNAIDSYPSFVNKFVGFPA